jgi:hypothetical protein
MENKNISDIVINIKDNLFCGNDCYLSIAFHPSIIEYKLELYCDDNCFISNGSIEQNDENLEHIFLYKIDIGNNYFLKIDYKKITNTLRRFHKFIYPNDYLEDNINITINKKNNMEEQFKKFFDDIYNEDNEEQEDFFCFYDGDDDDDSDMLHYKVINDENQEDIEYCNYNIDNEEEQDDLNSINEII